MENVATYLRYLRKHAGLPQKEAAEKAGLTAKTVERWEAAQHEPRISDIMPYLAAVGGHIDDVVDLLTGDAPDGEALAVRRIHHPLPAPDIPSGILRHLDELLGADRPVELATRRDMVAFGGWLRDSLHDLAALWGRTARHRNGE